MQAVNKKELLNKKLIWIIFALLLINYLLLGIINLNLSSDPQKFDTTAYLGEANVIKNNGGITNFLNLCLSGKYKQANQHPLYVLVLTPFASTDISFFINAKLISFVIGLIVVIVLSIYTRKVFGGSVTIISVTGLVLNQIFLEWTTMVASESLLMLMSLLSFYFIFKGFSNNKSWIIAGVTVGLAYLTKGTGLFLIPGFILSALFIYKLKIFLNKYFYLFFITFLITASPLLVRNIVLYKDPLFNVNKYIAEYSWEEIYNSKYTVFDPVEGTNQWKFEKVESSNDNTELNTIHEDKFNLESLTSKIFKEIKPHTQAFFYSFVIYQTAFSGLLEDIIFNVSLGKLFWIVSGFLFVMLVFGLIVSKLKAERIYTIITITIFILTLTLFRPITRYFLPVIPLIWIFIGLGINRGLELLMLKIKKIKIDIRLIFFVLVGFLLLLNIGYTLSKYKMSNPLKSVQYSDSRYELLNWLRENLRIGDTYTLGPNFNWQLNYGTWILPPMSGRENIEKLIPFIERHKIKYVIIDREFLSAKKVKQAKNETQNYFVLDPFERIVQLENIKGWTLVYEDNQKPENYLVYKIE